MLLLRKNSFTELAQKFFHVRLAHVAFAPRIQSGTKSLGGFVNERFDCVLRHGAGV